MNRATITRSGLLSSLALSLAMGPLPSAPRGCGRRALSMYMRSAHPRSQAYRVGAWPGDGVPSSLGTGGITRQKRRLAERTAEKDRDRIGC